MEISSSIWTVEVARALLDTICLLLVNSEQSMAEFSARYRCRKHARGYRYDGYVYCVSCRICRSLPQTVVELIRPAMTQQAALRLTSEVYAEG